MQIISTYSGIGGFELAGHWMGWETIQMCDIDPYSQKLLKARFPGVPIHGDIRTLTYEIIKESPKYNPKASTILVGGFPCQPYSTAGARKGNLDDRALWPESFRLLETVKPDAAVFENVAGITSMENEQPFENWLPFGMANKINFRRIYNRYIYRKRQTFVLNGIIEDIEKAGYSVQAFIIPACAVQASHRRDRIWLCAIRNDVILAANASSFQWNKKRKEGLFAEQWQGGYALSNTNGIGGEGIITNSQEFNDGQGFPEQTKGQIQQSGERIEQETSPNSNSKRQQRQRGTQHPMHIQKERKRQTSNAVNALGWATEPTIPRKHDGISKGLDQYRDSKRRNKGLGNAIVPQVAFQIFQAIEKVLDESRKNISALA